MKYKYIKFNKMEQYNIPINRDTENKVYSAQFL